MSAYKYTGLRTIQHESWEVYEHEDPPMPFKAIHPETGEVMQGMSLFDLELKIRDKREGRKATKECVDRELIVKSPPAPKDETPLWLQIVRGIRSLYREGR